MKNMDTVKYIIAGLILVLFVYGRYIEPNRVKIREINMGSNFSDTALKGKKIVHLSDLHISRMGKIEGDILKIIEQIKPDFIFLTGDYIPWNVDNKAALGFLSQLTAKYGVFGVMGDYDYSDSKNSCLFCHEKASGTPTRKHTVRMLRNSIQKINIDGQILKIAGIDEGYEEEDIADQVSPLVILSHSPLVFDDFSSKDKVFMFSGDTHGGQIKMPLWVFKLFGYEKNVKYNYGLFEDGNKIMYVTSGTGTSHFKFRLFCPPEIAVIQF